MRAWNEKPKKEEVISNLLWELEYWEDNRDWDIDNFNSAASHIRRIKDVLEYLDYYPEVNIEEL